MSFSSPLAQRIATIWLFAAPFGLVHCGDDDGGGSPPPSTGGGGGVSPSGGSAGKATGGVAPTGGAQATGGTTSGGNGSSGAPTGGKGTGGAGGTTGGMNGTPAGADSGGAGGEDVGGAGGEDNLGGAAGGGGEEDAVLHSILIGTFAPLPDYAGEPISGQALLVRTNEGETRVSVQVLGLEDDVDFPVHVHNQPCEFLAGSHYKIDPEGDDDDEDNEIWPTFTTDADGIGAAEVAVDHLARGDALAVVVHDPGADDAKMACADLTLDSDDPLSAKGTFAPFAQATDVDDEIEGTIAFVRSEDGSEITYSIAGLAEDTEYMSHVHALPCEVTDAGGHYKLDPTEEETIEANELWLDLGNTDDGEAEDTISSEHRARLDAQSVVLHRMDDDTSLKVACADLEVESYPAILVDGTGVALEAAEENGLDDLQALGSLRRSLDGQTRVRVSALGLAPDTEYPAHVHALPCSEDDGGPHYKIDTEEADTVEENELWLTIATNAEGEGSAEASFEHTARADARAIVIHEPEDNARLACIDLAP